MELSFVFSALRRRFWVVTLFALLGSLPGLTADPVVSDEYEAKAVLLVSPPTRSNLNVFNADPDRYVISQLSVLEGDSLAEEVAVRISTQFAEEITVQALALLVEIEHLPDTDIVEITAKIEGSPQKAAAIPQAYAELYVQGLETSDDDLDQRADFEKKIETLTNQLNATDLRLQEQMEKHLPREGDATPDPIPPVESVDPAAVSQRALLLSQLQTLNASLADLDVQSRLKVNTEIISNASVPTEPIPPGGNFLLAGGLLAGAILGVIVALLWARFSTKVLDDVSAGDLIGAPLVSEFPHYRSLARNPLAAFQALPRSAVPTIDQLCVRAEALARLDEPLTVVVTGTMRSAGSTTMSLAMAERFAAGGASVVLVDADVRDPRVTALFNATADGGVPSVIAHDGALVDQRGRSAFTRTMDPAVSVLGLGPNRGSASLRRDTVPSVLEAARRKAEIVVVDGGPVLDLASTIQFAALADAVVLAIPMARQKADSLNDMGRQLESVRHKLLPVATAPSRRAARGEVVGTDGQIAVPGAAGSKREQSEPRTGQGPPTGGTPTVTQAAGTVSASNGAGALFQPQPGDSATGSLPLLDEPLQPSPGTAPTDIG